VIIGFIGVAGLGVLALQIQSPWLGIVAVFSALQCFHGYKKSQGFKRLGALPRRPERNCPACEMNPPIGAFLRCSACQTAFDTFATGATCPKCAKLFPTTTCLDCGAQNPLVTWSAASETVGAVGEAQARQRAASTGEAQARQRAASTGEAQARQRAA